MNKRTYTRWNFHLLEVGKDLSVDKSQAHSASQSAYALAKRKGWRFRQIQQQDGSVRIERVE